MNWLLDLGNTRLKWAACGPASSLGEVAAVTHAAPDFLPRLHALLQQSTPGDRVWLASVAPVELAATLRAQLLGHGLQVQEVITQAQCLGVRIAYPQSSQLGVDRFLSLLATTTLTAQAYLLVSVGSALTIDLIDASRQHRGGVIAPTPAHLRQAMAERFPALAAASQATTPFATCTADAIAGGCLGSALGLIERSHRQATAWLGTPPQLVLTGGGADEVADHLDGDVLGLPHLVLQGMACYVAAMGAAAASPA